MNFFPDKIITHIPQVIKLLIFHSSNCIQSALGHASASEVLAVQEWGSEFGFPEPM